MNVLPCGIDGGKAVVDGQRIETVNASRYQGDGKNLELGVRPEFVGFAAAGLPAEIVKVADTGRYRIVETRTPSGPVKLLIAEGEEIPSGATFLVFDPGHAQVYSGSWIVE
jgi:glycerol transport system ATP-binding protein